MWGGGRAPTWTAPLPPLHCWGLIGRLLLHSPSAVLLSVLGCCAGKDIDSVKVVVCGCGAAGFTCAKYFVSLGVKKDNLLAVDVKVGVWACGP